MLVLGGARMYYLSLGLELGGIVVSDGKQRIRGSRCSSESILPDVLK